jgi:hypothetical protein
MANTSHILIDPAWGFGFAVNPRPMTIHEQLKHARANRDAIAQQMREAQLSALKSAPRTAEGYTPGMSSISAAAADPYLSELRQAEATVARLEWECNDEINQITAPLAD